MVTVKLVSIISIEAMVGLASTSSCTHSSPIFRHLIASFVEHESSMVGSMTSKGVLFFHCLHAYKIFKSGNGARYDLRYLTLIGLGFD